jgi:hypothetical protein
MQTQIKYLFKEATATRDSAVFFVWLKIHGARFVKVMRINNGMV